VYLDVAIYHCQQAAEKALKALLVFHNQRFQKTHDLRVLVELARPFDATIDQCLDLAERLTPYATASVIPAKCWSRIPIRSRPASPGHTSLDEHEPTPLPKRPLRDLPLRNETACIPLSTCGVG
jgi:hypothetical protein